MAGEIARLAVSLDASGVSGSASGAASSLQGLKSSFQSAAAEVKALETSMRAMQKGGVAIDISTFKGLQDQLTAAKATQSAAAQGFAKLGGSMTDLAGKPEAAADGLNAVMRASKAAAGPMGGLFEKLELLKGAFAGGGGLYAVAAIAAVGIIAMTAALGIAIFKMSEFALASSDAAFKTANLLEGVTGNAKAAGDLAGVIDRVSSKVPIASAEVQKLAQKLYESGKRGTALETELMKASAAASGLGKNPSAALLAKSLLSMDVQTMKFKEHIAKIFSGVKIEGFLKSIQEILSVFDDTTSSGKALKAIVEVMLNPLFGAASVVGPAVKNIFRGMVIGALGVAIAVLYVRNAFMNTFGGPIQAVLDAVGGKIDWMWAAVGAGVLIFAGLTVVVGVLTAGMIVLAGAVAIAGVSFLLAMVPVVFVLALVAVGFVLMAAAVLLPIVALIAVGVAIGYLIGYLMDLASAGAQAASGLIDGLVNGITSGGAAVIAAITGLAGSAKGALMSALGIGSPSKVFAELGVHTAAGFAEGVDAGSGDVNSAVGGMVDIPAAAPGKPSGGGSKGALTIGPIYIQGVKGAEEMTTTAFARKLAEAVEAMLDENGSQVPA